MARKRPPAAGTQPANPGPKTTALIQVRGTLAWKAWVEAFALANRTEVASLVDQALTELAQKRGFLKPPPKRSPARPRRGQGPGRGG